MTTLEHYLCKIHSVNCIWLVLLGHVTRCSAIELLSAPIGSDLVFLFFLVLFFLMAQTRESDSISAT